MCGLSGPRAGPVGIGHVVAVAQEFGGTVSILALERLHNLAVIVPELSPKPASLDRSHPTGPVCSLLRGYIGRLTPGESDPFSVKDVAGRLEPGTEVYACGPQKLKPTEQSSPGRRSAGHPNRLKLDNLSESSWFSWPVKNFMRWLMSMPS